MLREDRRFFLWTTLAGLTLRLFFFVHYPAFTDDSRVYFDLARNWLRYGIYGQTQLRQIVPTDARLPGYPAFLALVFSIFGIGNVHAVLIAQILFDLATCVVIADLARRMCLRRVSIRVAFGLAALCPFLASYASAALTETMEVFFTALALDCAVAGLERINGIPPEASFRIAVGPFAATGAAIAACILLRPDGGILLAAIGFYLAVHFGNSAWRSRRPSALGRMLAIGITVIAFAFAPLVPWTIRNFHAMHRFQPLAPRYANETEEQTPIGFNRWVKTWLIEYVSVEDIYWNVPGDKIDADKLPARALDEPTRGETLALIADYNQSQELTPDLDARFAQLAAERNRVHPLRCHVLLPSLRVADMWLRPRTDFLPADIRWWEFNDDLQWSIVAVGFGLLNLAYVASALAALIWKHSEVRYVGLLLCFLVLRTAFLATVENPEPRYTLECFPALIALASILFTSARPTQSQS